MELWELIQLFNGLLLKSANTVNTLTTCNHLAIIACRFSKYWLFILKTESLENAILDVWLA